MVCRPQSRGSKGGRLIISCQSYIDGIDTLKAAAREYKMDSLVRRPERNKWVFSVERPCKSLIIRMYLPPRIYKASSHHNVIRWICPAIAAFGIRVEVSREHNR